MEWITDIFLPFGFVAVGQDMRGTGCFCCCRFIVVFEVLLLLLFVVVVVVVVLSAKI